MPRLKALDELTPADLWREVPEQEDEFWQDARERQQRLLKALLEGALEEEMTVLIGAGRFRRTEERHGQRNGFYQRDLATQIGIVTAIRVPRARGAVVERSVFSRYQRRHSLVNKAIRDVFLAGVSTRRVGASLEALLGERVSAQTVSRVTRSLDREVARFHKAPLADDVQYLLLDGVYLRVKGAASVRRRLVLCAYAFTVEGKRRLLDFRLAQAESAAQWEAFLSQLRERGLHGRKLKLAVTDGCAGLHAALDTVYPYAPRQHCWVHKLRNVASYLHRRNQQACLRGARRIYLAQNRREALQAWKEWKDEWETVEPEAVRCLARDLEALLTFLKCPEQHRTAVRTTNYIERLIRELRRRTRPMGAFADKTSCERLFYGVIKRLNRRWTDRKPLPGFTQNT